MRALFILSLFIVLVALAGCYTDAPTRLPEVAELGLVPLTPPEQERGASLFAEHCASCHGESGRGDGWRVPELEGPRPRDFHDKSAVAAMSPARAYLAVTQGVPRTSMKPFDLLIEPDRWHLAFYILSLGYDEAAAERGRATLASLDLTDTNPRMLSELSNKDILAKLTARGLTPASAEEVLAHLRRDAAFEHAKSVLSPARMAIVESIADYRRGRHDRAKDSLRATHLNDLKNKYKILRLRDSGLTLASELELEALSELMHASASLREIENRALTLLASMDEAEPLLSQELGTGVAIAQSASISLSHAIDGALCLFLLLVMSARRGSDRRERHAVGLGIVVGLALAGILWMGWRQPSQLIDGSLQTGLGLAVSALIALGCLPLLAATVRYFRWPPQERIHAAPSWLAALFLLASGIVLRDALEIMPTLAVLTENNAAALVGFVGAIVAIVCIVVLLVAIESRLLVAARTALLCISIVTSAVIAAGAAARCAQELGLLGASPAGHLQSPWLSLWPTGQGVLVQMCFAGACVLALVAGTLLHEQSEA